MSTSRQAPPGQTDPDGPAATHEPPPSARLGAFGLVHPFPSTLVAVSTGALGLIAGGTIAQAAVLALAMGGFQASIGTINDLRDRDDDARTQPWKPIPSGRVSPRTARSIAVVGAVVGALGSLALGPGALLVGLFGYGLGLAYDLRLKRTAWGWLCFAIALPLVPVYAWLGVGEGLPPQAATLFLLGALAGTELAIANGLVDAPGDGRLGGLGIAVRLGATKARAAMAVASLGVLGVAWVSIGTGAAAASPASLGTGVTALVIGSLVVVAGVAMSLRHAAAWSWRGWQAQGMGVAILALAWLVVVTQ